MEWKIIKRILRKVFIHIRRCRERILQSFCWIHPAKSKNNIYGSSPLQLATTPKLKVQQRDCTTGLFCCQIHFDFAHQTLIPFRRRKLTVHKTQYIVRPSRKWQNYRIVTLECSVIWSHVCFVQFFWQSSQIIVWLCISQSKNSFWWQTDVGLLWLTFTSSIANYLCCGWFWKKWFNTTEWIAHGHVNDWRIYFQSNCKSINMNVLFFFSSLSDTSKITS